MKKIKFKMGNGEVIKWGDLTGLPDPITTEEDLKDTAECAMETDSRIESYELYDVRECEEER